MVKMEQITTVVNGKAVKEYIYSTFITSLVGLIASILLFIFYIVMSLRTNNWADIINIIGLVLGILCFILSIFLLYKFFSAVSKANKNPATITYTFNDDGFDFVWEKNQGTIAYKDLMGYRESKHYLFVVRNIQNVFTLNKSEELVNFLKEKQIQKIKRIKR